MLGVCTHFVGVLKCWVMFEWNLKPGVPNKFANMVTEGLTCFGGLHKLLTFRNLGMRFQKLGIDFQKLESSKSRVWGLSWERLGGRFRELGA